MKKETLKKVFYFILAMLCLATVFSCSDERIVTIDGCEYIQTTSYTGQGPVTSNTHKGNCKNLIHKK